MQAIEFWSTLAEIEMMYREEDEENGVSSGAPNTECKHFLDRCTNDLVPLLLDLLLTQEEGQDDSDTEWYAPRCLRSWWRLAQLAHSMLLCTHPSALTAASAAHETTLLHVHLEYS